MVLAGSVGLSPSKKRSAPCVKLPRLPFSNKTANNVSKAGHAGNNSACGQPAEKENQLFKQGPAAVKRRLGGTPATSQNSNAHNSTGLKRAFKVPRNR
jgi:hypothetical protein